MGGRVREFPPAAHFVEDAPGLWDEPGHPSDNVSADYVLAHPPAQSLVVIRAGAFHVVPTVRVKDDVARRRWRCRFRYKAVDYDLPLTDPAAARRFDASAGAAPAGGNIILCVSLAAAYRGRHYKVVATVFEAAPCPQPPTPPSSPSATRITTRIRSWLSSGGTG